MDWNKNIRGKKSAIKVMRGLSLVEVIVGLVLLSVAGLAISSTMSLVGGSKARSPTGSLEVQATGYAREALDWLKNSVSTNSTNAASLFVLESNCGVGKSAGDPCGSRTFGPFVPATGFTRNYTVTDIADGNGGLAYKKVTVIVTWTDP